MPYTGEGRLNTLMLGEAPGGEEDRRNTQFVGEVGQLLRKHLESEGFDLDRDFWKRNVVNCRPTDENGYNRTPTKRELQCCEHTWRHTISELRPEFIFLLGGEAVKAFFMNRSQPITKNLTITRWRRLCIPDPITQAWVIPMFHPSFAKHSPDAEPLVKGDLVYGLNCMKPGNRLQPPEFHHWEKFVEPVVNFSEIMRRLHCIVTKKPGIVIDYETNRKRPYQEGSQIFTIGIAESDQEKTWAFPYKYPGYWNREQLEAITYSWIAILEDPNILKTAQSIQMEESWSRIIFGIEVQGWDLDTMVCSHIKDERDGFTGLDFQVFINWGYEYGQDIAPFKKEVSNGFNLMHQVPLNKLLIYNGQDTFFTKELALIRLRELYQDSASSRAYDLFHDGIMSFCDMEMDGVHVDVDYYQQLSTRLEKRIKFLENQLLNGPEAQLFFEKTRKKLDLDSNQKLSKLLFDYMGIEPIKRTKTGYSVDKDVLQQISIPFTHKLSKLKKIKDNKRKYTGGILKYEINGKLHTSLNLHLVRTYRSSSNDPNLHNVPVQDRESMQMVRGGIIPSPGHKILEADYKAMEVCIIACLSKDKQLCKNIEDKVDPHQEWADFLGLEKYTDPETARYDAKNKVVFPWFYGSHSVAEYLEKAGYPPEIPIVRAEREFWKKHRGVKNWQKLLLESYQANGYVEMPFGFRRRGFLTTNQIINTPVQGTAFHCLLWSINHINPVRKEEGWRTKMPLQIHDDIFFDLYPKEEDHVIKVATQIMTEDIRKENPWLIVPLTVEFKTAGIDEPWSKI